MRFDKRIYLQKPSAEARVFILKKGIENVKNSLSEKDF